MGASESHHDNTDIYPFKYSPKHNNNGNEKNTNHKVSSVSSDNWDLDADSLEQDVFAKPQVNNPQLFENTPPSPTGTDNWNANSVQQPVVQQPIGLNDTPPSPTGTVAGWDIDTVQNFDQTPPSPTGTAAGWDDASIAPPINTAVPQNDIFEKQDLDNNSSPFISTEMYNNIMKNSEQNTDSPFVSKNEYEQLMKGGHNDSSSSFRSVKSISISSVSDPNVQTAGDSSSTIVNLSDFSSSPRKVTSESSTQNVENSNSGSEYNIKMYGFSDTSSEVIKTSENNYVTHSNSSNTPYKVNSSSVNTSDIELVSVDDVSVREGQRFLQ